MNMHDSQPREENGQYGSHNHSYPEVVLAENVDGSFLFPPHEWPGGASQYVEFWKTQPISDEALTNFASCYAEEWDAWASALFKDHLEQWGNSEEGRQVRREADAASDRAAFLKRARDAEYDRFNVQLKAMRPERIPTGVVRQVARAAQIVHNVKHLRESERAEVGRTVIYNSQNNEPWTAEQLWDRYRLGDIMPDAFYARENALLRQMRMSMN